MEKKWKYIKPARHMLFGTPINIGSHYLEDEKGFRHMASPVHKDTGIDPNTGKYKFKLVGFDVGVYGVIPPDKIKDMKKFRY